MRVCVLGCSNYPPEEGSGLELINHLPSVDFFVLCRRAKLKDGKVVEVPYLNLKLARAPSHSILSVPAAKKVIESQGIDVIHAFGSFAGMTAGMLKKMTGTPYVLTMERVESAQSPFLGLRGPLSEVERRAVAEASWITCPNRFVQHVLIEKRGAPLNKTVVIPPAIDTEKFQEESWWAKLKLNAPEKLVACFLDNGQAAKPVLEAVEKLKDYTFWIMTRQRLRVGGNVRIGSWEERELLAAADVVVLPYPKPAILLSAMAAKKPILASTVDEIFEGCGWMIERSAASIIEGVKALEDKKLRNKLAAAAARRAKKHDWKVIAPGFLELYKSCSVPS